MGSNLSAGRLSALRVIVSELVTNSVKYGPGGPINLSVTVSEDGSVLGRIEDGGQGQVVIREDVDPADGGMGLKLVDAFTDRWWVEEGTSKRLVRARGAALQASSFLTLRRSAGPPPRAAVPAQGARSWPSSSAMGTEPPACWDSHFGREAAVYLTAGGSGHFCAGFRGHDG